MITFTRLAHNYLLEAEKVSRKPDHDSRLAEQAYLQTATVYAILDLKATLVEVLTELRELKNKE